MPQRIIFDGLNLALEEGTGVATYARMLTRVARDLGHKVGVVYGSPQAPSRNPLLREIAFFDEKRAITRSKSAEKLDYILDGIRYHLPVRPTPVEVSGVVVTRQFDETLLPSTLYLSHATCLPTQTVIFGGPRPSSISISTRDPIFFIAPTSSRCGRNRLATSTRSTISYLFGFRSRPSTTSAEHFAC
jgi:hypothetical protein